jgi:hypothetical protein
MGWDTITEKVLIFVKMVPTKLAVTGECFFHLPVPVAVLEECAENFDLFCSLSSGLGFRVADPD